MCTGSSIRNCHTKPDTCYNMSSNQRLCWHLTTVLCTYRLLAAWKVEAKISLTYVVEEGRCFVCLRRSRRVQARSMIVRRCRKASFEGFPGTFVPAVIAGFRAGYSSATSECRPGCNNIDSRPTRSGQHCVQHDVESLLRSPLEAGRNRFK